MSKPKMVDVEIWAEERVVYRQTVRMSKAVFDRLNKAMDDDEFDETDAEEAMDFLDRTDVFEADDFEIHEFKLAAPEALDEGREG